RRALPHIAPCSDAHRPESTRRDRRRLQLRVSALERDRRPPRHLVQQPRVVVALPSGRPDQGRRYPGLPVPAADTSTWRDFAERRHTATQLPLFPTRLSDGRLAGPARPLPYKCPWPEAPPPGL